MVTVQFIIGWIMPEIRRQTSPQGLVSFHISFGFIILALMVLRLLWRLTQKVPPLPTDTPALQETAARAVHYLLYATLIVLPLTGWGLASARGWQVTVFNMVTLPPIAQATQASVRLYDNLHVTFVTIVCILIGVHVAAALYHYIWLKDDVVQRMLPKRTRT
jgi:cytochrome b561